MEHPNAKTCNIRRHSSVPTIRRRISSRVNHHRQLCAKRNPYVGWFRHSPPLTRASFASTTWQSGKVLPYAGKFRHSLSLKLSTSLILDYIQQELPLWLRAIPSRDTNGLLSNLKEILCSHLKGGSPHTWTPKKEKSSSLSSLTLSLLRRVNNWLLDVQEDDTTWKYKRIDCASIQSHKESSCCFSDEASSSSEDSVCSHLTDDESHRPRRRRSASLSSSTSLMVSSQAEAYYAHSWLESRTRPTSQDDSLLGRLDYDITQMDIVRMTRNAARHLDVESILKLPTITYSDASPIATPEEPDTKKQEWSWMMVAPDSDVQSLDSIKTISTSEQQKREQNVCVICLEHFVNGDRLRVLPCNHSFHVGCIDQWLSGSQSFEECYTAGCPTCKKRPDRQSSREDGSVPSWAFTRIGSVLAQSDRSISI